MNIMNTMWSTMNLITMEGTTNPMGTMVILPRRVDSQENFRVEVALEVEGSVEV